MSRGAKRVPVVLVAYTFQGPSKPIVTVQVYSTKELDIQFTQLPDITDIDDRGILEELMDCEFDELPKRHQRLNWPGATDKNGGLLAEYPIVPVSIERKMQSHYETLVIKSLQDEGGLAR